LLRFTAADAKAQLQRCVLEVLPHLS
jgi:hypothetical protein